MFMPIPHVRGPAKNPLQDVAAARLERLALGPQIAGEPGNLWLPGLDDAGGWIRVRGNLLLMNLLRHAVKGCTGAQFRSAHGALKMLDRHHLGFRHAMHIDIARQQVLNATFLERGFQGLGAGSIVCHRDCHLVFAVNRMARNSVLRLLVHGRLTTT